MKIQYFLLIQLENILYEFKSCLINVNVVAISEIPQPAVYQIRRENKYNFPYFFVKTLRYEP